MPNALRPPAFDRGPPGPFVWPRQRVIVRRIVDDRHQRSRDPPVGDRAADALEALRNMAELVIPAPLFEQPPQGVGIEPTTPIADEAPYLDGVSPHPNVVERTRRVEIVGVLDRRHVPSGIERAIPSTAAG